MIGNAISRHPVPKPAILTAFPFGVEFQRSLLRLLTEDTAFAHTAIPHLLPGYFENEVLAWAYNILVKYRDKYDAIPSLRVVIDETKRLDASVREFYRLTIEQVAQADMSAELWLRDQCLDFIKRNIFVRAMQESTISYNTGKVREAYEVMMHAADKIFNTDWKPVDRGFFFNNFSQRYAQRLGKDPLSDSIPTGIHELDHVLGGGLSKGEMGIWMAHSKRGKTTMLINHGVQAVRRASRNVLHLVFEGAREQVEARYDTVFAQESYYLVKTSGISRETFERMQYDYRMFTDKLVIRGFTEEWEYTVSDIHEELRELKKLYAWIPDLIIVDYGDLLRGRGDFRTETQHQTAAFRDLKSLANRGYGLWTATQPQRPKDDIDSKTDLLMARKIADSYGKIRIADFFGSINQTKEERMSKTMRLFAEMYRDNEAGKVITVYADFDFMTIANLRETNISVLPAPVHGPVPLGYVANGGVKPQQKRAPI